MITIPGQTKQYIQTNQSDNLGTLYATKNCDFDTNKGVIQLGKRLILNTATADLATLTNYPLGFTYFVDGVANSFPFFTAAGVSGTGKVFRALTLDTGFVADSGSGTPTAVDSAICDIKVGLEELYVSLGGSVKYLTASSSGAWGSIGSVGTTGVPNPMCTYGGRQYLASSNKVESWNRARTVASPNSSGTDSSNTIANSTFLPNRDLVATWILPTTKGMFIGTVNPTGGKAYIYFWNGSDTQITSQYRLNSAGALAAVIKNDVPLIMDSNGAVQDWNGGTFLELARIWRKSNKPLYNPYYTSNQRFIHPNGMAIIQGKPHFNLDLTNYDAAGHLGTQEDCNPSGIWVYDETTKDLKHKYSFGLSKSAGTITDYGQFRIGSGTAGAGALAEMLTAQAPITTNGTFLAGCSYFTSATASTSGIFYDDTNDTLKKAGYFVTSTFSAGASKMSITDLWNKAYVFHSKFLNATDKMVVKYRTVQGIPIEGVITWIDTGAFSTTLNLSSYVIGDEIEVLQGIGAGLCSHITNIQTSDTGYIVNVDEVYTGASGTARARFSKWIKAGNIQDTEDFDESLLNTTSTWIQLKVFMIWAGTNEFLEIMITNEASKQAE